MSLVGAVNSDTHQCRDYEVKTGSNDSVVEGLSQCSILSRQGKSICRSDYQSNEEGGSDEPAHDRYGLCDCKGKTAGHIEEKSKIGCEREEERDAIDSI